MPEESALTDEERARVEHLVHLEEDVDAVCAAIPALTPAQLHEFCCEFNWDDDLRPLHVALEQPRCEYSENPVR